MPIYEYRCQSCEHQFDALQKMSDDPLKECPACGQLELVKLVSAPSFRLSGSGWYETDFKTDKDKKRNLADSKTQESKKQESGEKKSSEKSGEKKTEKLSKQIGQLEEKRTNLKQEIKTLQKEKQTLQPSDTDTIGHARQIRASKKQLALNALVSYLDQNPSASLAEMGDAIGRSKSTAGDYINELKEIGRIYKNGQGWKVTPPNGEVANV